MKKSMILLMACVVLSLSLVSCGGSDAANAAAGTYQGKYTKMVGDSEKNEAGDFSLVLESNGKGTHKRDGLEIEVEWELDGESFKMTETFMGVTLEYTGTLTGSTLDIFNGDVTDVWTYEYVYKKE